MALAEQVISEIRTLSYALHPPLIDEAGLVGALKWYAAGFEKRSGVKVTLDVREDIVLPRAIEEAVFRIVQEMLTNIQRHSGSGVARIGIECEPRQVRLTVADKGRGIPFHFRDNREALFASGVGMASIRERVRDLGGELHIDSSAEGTSLAVTFPLAGV